MYFIYVQFCYAIFALYSNPIFNSFALIKAIMRVWLLSAVVSAFFMLILSFIWHGFVLSDFEKLIIPVSSHLLKMAIAYMIIGVILTLLLNNFKNKIPKKYFGILLGALLGIVFYSLILVFSNSFGKSFIFHSYQREHILLDYAWQIIEQGLGGLIAARAILFFGSWKKSI